MEFIPVSSLRQWLCLLWRDLQHPQEMPLEATAWAVLRSSTEGGFVTDCPLPAGHELCLNSALRGMKLNPHSGKRKELIWECPELWISFLPPEQPHQAKSQFKWDALIPPGKRGVPMHVIEWL